MSDLALFIACPSCRTIFRLKGEALQPSGRDVRCSSCTTSWHVHEDGTNGAIIVPEEPVLEEVSAPVEDNYEGSEVISAPLEDVQAPSLVPVNEVPLSFRKIVPQQKIETKSRKQVPISLVMLIVAVMSCVGFVLGRESILKNYPQSASVYAALGFKTNLTDLEFSEVVSSRTLLNNQDVLVIEGKVNNLSKDARQVPQLKLVVRNKVGKEIYFWTVNASKPSLEGGEVIEFRARLAQPPEGAHDVVVRFNQ